MSLSYSDWLVSPGTQFFVLGPFAPGEIVTHLHVAVGGVSLVNRCDFLVAACTNGDATLANILTGRNLCDYPSDVTREFHVTVGMNAKIPVGLRFSERYRFIVGRVINSNSTMGVVLSCETNTILEV